jgi:hypothetical protein
MRKILELVLDGKQIHSKLINLHELTPDELANHWVSEHSQFKDVRWIFTNLTNGSRNATSTINWAMTLFDGSQLTDRRHVVRLAWAKILVMSILTLPAKGRAPSPGAIGGIQNELNVFLSWMSARGIRTPDELSPLIIEQYISDLPAFVSAREHYEGADDEGIGVAVFDRALAPLMRLWDQRAHLKLFNVESISHHPFDGKGAHSIALKLATKAQGWIMPLPDEVAIPLFNSATRWLGAPADDVIRLLDVFEISGNDDRAQGKAKKDRLRAENKFLREFSFSPAAAEAQPWRKPLATKNSAAMVEMREMYDSVRDAALVVVQGTSGMRVSELCGIEEGIDETTGLPRGVRLEASLTGLYEWFVIRTELSKTKEGTPLEVDWVLGMRPMGSADIPLAIRALTVLNKLSAPWRAAAKSTKLILSARAGMTLPRPSTPLTNMKGDGVRRVMKRFLERCVDLSSLPDESARKISDNDLVRWRESQGRIFTTHMLRKSWANFTLACDSRLLPVIQMQFHHVSLAMTEGGYIGKNPVLVDALDSISRQRTNHAIFDLINQHSVFAGRMGEHLESQAQKLREKLAGLPVSERWSATVEWVDENQIKMFFSPYATCAPLKPSEMRCHDESETPIWIRHQPDFETREPNLCAGCTNAVMDRSHKEFWVNRYVGYAVSLAVEQKQRGGVAPEQRVIEFRANQALAILKKLGANMSEVNSKLTLELEK